MANDLYQSPEPISCQRALTEKIFSNPEPFLEAKKNWLLEKNTWEHGKVMSYSVKESESYTRGVKRKVKGKEKDFWPLEIYNLLFSEQQVREVDAERYFFQGKSHIGVWREATEAMLPKGALCRAQEEFFESNQSTQEIKNSLGGTLERDPVPKKRRLDEKVPCATLKDKELNFEDQWSDLGLQVQTALKMVSMSTTLKKDIKNYQTRYLSSTA